MAVSVAPVGDGVGEGSRDAVVVGDVSVGSIVAVAVGSAVPVDALPSEIADLFHAGGKRLVLVNSSYKSGTDELGRQLDEMNAIVKKYDANGLITGEGAMTKDLIEVANLDFQHVNITSILAVFAIIALSFKSLSIPVLLVAAIEGAIMINMGIPYFTGTTLPFIASIVIGVVQLGATGQIDWTFLYYCGGLTVLVLGLHIVLRYRAPQADPFVVPIATVLSGLGLAMIYRIDIEDGDSGWAALSTRQLAWLVIADALAPDGRLVIIGMQGGVKGELNIGKLIGKRLRVIGTALRGRPVDGAHGKSGIGSVMGSVAFGVLQGQSRVPVLVVRK